MPKGQQKTNREAKKPKADKSKKATGVTVSPFSEPAAKPKPPARDK